MKRKYTQSWRMEFKKLLRESLMTKANASVRCGVTVRQMDYWLEGKFEPQWFSKVGIRELLKPQGWLVKAQPSPK